MSNKVVKNHAAFQIGLKVLIWKDDKFLVLKSAPSGLFDLPGGRVNENEKKVDLMAILNREIVEELGNNLKIKVNGPLFQFRRYFPDREFDVFITVYEAYFLSGEIKISEEHREFYWMGAEEFVLKSKEFLHEEEWKAFKDYLEKIES